MFGFRPSLTDDEIRRLIRTLVQCHDDRDESVSGYHIRLFLEWARDRANRIAVGMILDGELAVDVENADVHLYPAERKPAVAQEV